MLLLTIIILSILIYSSSYAQAQVKEGFVADAFNLKNTLPLRGALALGILSFHTSLLLRPQTPILAIIIHEIQSWSIMVVAGFFFLTGYGLITSIKAKGAEYLHGFLSKRIKKLFPAFIITSILIEIENLGKGDLTIDTLLADLQHGPGYSWYVYAIVIFYILFKIIFSLTRNQSPSAITWKICIYAIVVLALIFVAEHILHWAPHYYASSYAVILGMFYAHYEHYIKHIYERFPLSTAFVFTCLILVLYVLHEKSQIPVAYRCIQNLLPIALVFIIYSIGRTKSPVLSFIGSISYEIYLSHALFVGMYVLIVERLNVHWSLFALFVLFASITTAYIIHHFQPTSFIRSCKNSSTF